MSKKNRETNRTERAAAAMRQQSAHERRRRNLMVGVVVVALLVIVGGGYLLSRALDTTDDVAAPAAGSDYGLTLGPEDAPHEVVIYEDFLCPYCGDLEDATREDFARLAADGAVRVEYRPFNLLSAIGDYSERATATFAIVLDTAGPEVAKKFHDLLYENQPEESGPYLSDDDLVDLAVEAGADEDKVRAGIEDGDGKEWVVKATQNAVKAGVRGTPTVVLDDEVFQEGRTMEEMAKKLIDRLE